LFYIYSTIYFACQFNPSCKPFFGISNAKTSQLEGYDSVNYKIESEKGVFVLKQNPYSEETLELLQAENQIFEQLEVIKAYDFPVAISSVNGEFTIKENNQLYRLLSYIEGDFLGDVKHTSTLLRSLGEFLAKMDKQIHKKSHSAFQGKETQWDLKYFNSNYKYLQYIPNATDKSRVDYFFLQFDEHSKPIENQLRKRIIHNDANDWNVLTKKGKVSGIIDFGDMCHSWLINEVAIALTYVMMGKENPISIANELIKGYHEILPLEEKELDFLYYLIAARLCTSVCNSAYAKTLKPDSDYITVSEKPAWDLLRKWLSINPVKAKDAFRKAAGFKVTNKKNTQQQLKRRKANFSDALSISYSHPIQMQQSAFQYMYDVESNTYLDAYNNIMLAGHCHPKVVRAGQKAMAKLNTNTRYLYDELLSYSEKLLAKFPEKLNKVFFVNSGSAASDLAIRMATTYTQKQKIMILEHGYHGNTRLGIDISHYKYAHEGGPGQQANIISTPMPKAFSSGYKDDGSAGDYYTRKAKQQIDENNNEIAAFIAEPIVGCGGQVPLAKGYLKKVYETIRAQGGICISDEIQVGFGRLGDYFWGYEMHDVVPDMVILGKPMANGHPIGAVVTTLENASSFNNGLEFFSSFGGNPVSCAIGESVLDTIKEEGLQTHAKRVGNYLIDKLKNLQIKYLVILDVRGSGLFIGVEIGDSKTKHKTHLAAAIKNGLRENHILISTDGPEDNVLKIKPPLSFNASNADQLVLQLSQQLEIY
jgi:4-aminobutyrate aminotransferase-like enzyme/aminoglycoside phosphotransferase (APT) family kinase protein